MKIHLDYNDVILTIEIHDDYLNHDEQIEIQHRTSEFFNRLQTIVLKNLEAGESQSDSENIKSETYDVKNDVTKFETFRGFVPEKIQSSDESLEIESTQTINPITGDKRVEKKRYEDMSVEELGVDSRGIPWNPEIHAATKTKRKDGTWKLKKGANLLQAAQEEKKLLQDLPPPPPLDETIEEIQQREIPKTFNEMVNFIDEIMDTGRIDINGVLKILSDLGFNNIIHLKGNESKYPEIYKQFHTALGGVL